MTGAGDQVRVLHVDDDIEFLEVTSTFLEREDNRLAVETAADADGGLARLDDADVDCVISDFDMPSTNGIEFLNIVREQDYDLPFILFTGKGSEEVAGDAITAGVTDYLQKRPGTDQYTVLANRVVNAVSRARAERERTRHLDAIETAQEGIGIIDRDERFIYVNRAFAELHGYEPNALVGSEWELIYPEDDIPTIREDVLPFVEETGYWHGTTTALRADGSTFVEDHVLSRTADGELICTVRDITDIRQREDQLDVLARRYEAIFENPTSLIVLLNPDGMILEINPPALHLEESPVEEIVGKPIWEIPGWSQESDLRHWIAKAADGEPVRFEAEYPDADKNPVTIDGLFHPIRDEAGSVTELLLIGRDISNRKEREDELRRERDRLEDFMRVISHDLRTPLNVASVRLDLVTEEFQSEHFGPIQRSHERIQELLNNLEDLARTEASIGTVEQRPIETVARTSWETVATGTGSLKIDVQREISANQSQLKQLLENIFRNAIDHGGENVTVRLGELKEGDGFYIADDGPGIPTSERDRVFEMGYTQADNHTGLGLRIVSRIVEAHGWDITVAESAAGGARFEISGVEFADTINPQTQSD